MSILWNLPDPKTINETQDPSGWATVEKLQELNGFLLNNQVLQCSTHSLLDAILRELRGLRRDIRRAASADPRKLVGKRR